MNITVAIDSMKGSLSTFQSGDAIKEGIRRVIPDANVTVCPIADGGEGTVEAIVSATCGEWIETTVKNPLGLPVPAKYGISDKTAVLEMAAASGITLISEEERNPMHTTTYGVGELLRDAIQKGCRKFVIGIGGSATNDGGIGMLQALGFEFLNQNGEQVPFGAKGLSEIVTIRTENALKELSECEFSVACDVTNPLCGERGASAVYGPQKGATPEMVKQMDIWLKQYADLTKTILPKADENYPGAGAAGGLGFAFLSYLNARLESGVDMVIRETGLSDKIRNTDIVITGEGRLDGQSYQGKAPIGVAKLAKQFGKTVIAFSGCVTEDAKLCNEHGIDAFFPIVRTPCSLSDAMNVENAYRNLADTAEQVFRLILACK
ncbi:MAG: glycerate kinase [Clostridia bacterium]|nr:glycerate kinase [Clostridia bacterium]